MASGDAWYGVAANGMAQHIIAHLWRRREAPRMGGSSVAYGGASISVI